MIKYIFYQKRENMDNSNAFPPIFCISLARATERRANMRRRLDLLGMPYEIVDAVDGRELNLAKLESEGRLRQDLAIRRYRRHISKGEIGIYLSHYNLWQKIADENIESALVLEDDAGWADDFLPVISKLYNMHCSWDIITFYTDPRTYGGDLAWKIPNTKYSIIRGKLRIGGICAYFIRFNSAKKLLDWCYKIKDPIDVIYSQYWHNGLVFYGIKPQIVNQVESISLIEDRARLDVSLAVKIGSNLWRKSERWQQRIYNIKNPIPK